ncbi:MAG: serine/threonine protein kinase, partial [Cyanobacteria bacterium]|nr:serine/threonine protein kinase [Cyanobacteriota bacterium]
MTGPSEEMIEQLRQTAKCEAVSLGTVVRGRYQIISYLGRGGMSTVYKALDTRGARTVALKILHTELLSDTT